MRIAHSFRGDWAALLSAVVGLAPLFLLASFAHAEEITGNEPVVAEVNFVGNQTLSSERIQSQIKTIAGRPYRAEVVREDVKRLVGTNWFYDIIANEKRTDAGVVVTFNVAERPIIHEVKYVGSRAFDEKKLVGMTGLKPGKPMNPGLNREAALRIERKYREKGYPFAQVELLEGGKRGDTRVIFNITEGPKTKVKWLAVEGNKFVSDARIKTLLSSGPLLYVFPGKYDPMKVEEDVAKLIEYYKGNGFLDAKIGRKLEWTEDKSGVKLTFLIDEGLRYAVHDVRFSGNALYDASKLSDQLKLTSGSTLDQGKLQHDLQKVRDAYGSKGYIKTVVNADVRYLDDPGQVDIVYQVKEDTPRRVGEVRIQGNEITKDKVVRSYMELSPGELADTVKLRRSQQLLTETRLFQVDPAQGIMPTVQFDPNTDPNSEFQDILVRVQEAQTGSLMFGVGVNSDAGVGGSLVVNERNFDIARVPTSFSELFSGRAFRGAGQELRIEAVPGNLVNRYAVTFREPRLFGLDYSLTTSGYYFRRIYQPYLEERGGGRFTLGKRFSRTIGAGVTWRVENINISRPATPTPPDLQSALGNNFLTSGRISMNHDTRDSALAPSEGHFIELGFEQAFGDYTFPRADLEARQYWTFYSRGDGSGKQILSLRGQLGYTGSQTPIFERFYAGGFTTIRGFQFRGVSPTVNGIEVGGDWLMLSSLEYYVPLTADDNFGAVVFCDAGTVESNVEIKDYRVALGFGLRIKVPMMGPMPLAFDFGFPVAQKDTDDRQLFSFFVGLFR